MNKDMCDIFQLVADQLANSKFKNISQPDVYIIMNMMAQANQQVKNECWNRL